MNQLLWNTEWLKAAAVQYPLLQMSSIPLKTLRPTTGRWTLPPLTEGRPTLHQSAANAVMLLDQSRIPKKARAMTKKLWHESRQEPKVSPPSAARRRKTVNPPADWTGPRDKWRSGGWPTMWVVSKDLKKIITDAQRTSDWTKSAP